MRTDICGECGNLQNRHAESATPPKCPCLKCDGTGTGIWLGMPVRCDSCKGNGFSAKRRYTLASGQTGDDGNMSSLPASP